MPHLIIEHSNNLPIPAQQLVEAVHLATQSTALFDPTTLKTRTQSTDYYKLAEGKIGFVHIHAHLIEGRSEAQKQLLSNALLEVLQTMFDTNWLLSVHPYDLLPSIYRKN
ncbi:MULTISPECIES: 5-carboxymethyl-2-hydroxymuconate isomerase [Pseudoalteromonas]|uniref:5-carboxymethyl-2-hydroxymuconate isomerase n=1 Tax=Pseudoalteromonas amylolytica TaxID=1859457 RepID=A0A1S1MY26_9GAMM|nr:MULTISPECIES: 5-carboxymethyl-2-hydroxymuconate isomerase [Pseudoalteromonas]OHU89088.1 5-carboxymethyl-2-hydroxymuconate isomerase [Pseudoalteromonas sp. JW3]OHU91988.1 5-carboxymethyl-2-hydroxymuconate isomerase [Pseudoalteromonas amylolytica]